VPKMGVEGYTSSPEAATVVVLDEQPVTVPASGVRTPAGADLMRARRTSRPAARDGIARGANASTAQAQRLGRGVVQSTPGTAPGIRSSGAALRSSAEPVYLNAFGVVLDKAV